jgi:REP element-mobilizing transposase RayT
MPDSYTNLLYHIVFSTKDRPPLITTEYQAQLYDYIDGTIRAVGGISLEVNGTEDHVHLAKLRPDRSLSDVLRDLKSKRNRRLCLGSPPRQPGHVPKSLHRTKSLDGTALPTERKEIN